MAIDQGRTELLWAKLEAAYGTEQALVAANGIRYISMGRSHQPKNRVDSPEKNASPGRFRRFDRKPSTSGTGLNFNVQPSGTLNTLSEQDPFFEAAFGTKTNRTVATTVASSPTTSGCTVAAVGTLAVGDAVFLEVTGQPLVNYIRVLTSVAGNVLTWAPTLAAAQTVGDDVKGTITYKLSTALALSITALRALPSGKKEELTGWGMDTMNLAFDANNEIQATFGGPAKTLLTTATAQAAPGSSTFVGTQHPPSGITDGYTMIGNAVYLMKSMSIDLANSLNPRNSEYGVLLPTEMNRNGIRTIDMSLDAFSETEATLKDLSEAGTLVSVLNQTGKTQGNIVAVYMPKVDFAYPDQDDPPGERTWTFPGAAMESAQGDNKELVLVFA